MSLDLLAASLFFNRLAQYRSSLCASGTCVCFLRFLAKDAAEPIGASEEVESPSEIGAEEGAEEVNGGSLERKN